MLGLRRSGGAGGGRDELVLEGAESDRGRVIRIRVCGEAHGRETPHRSRCGREWCGLNLLRQVGGATCLCADESVGRRQF